MNNIQIFNNTNFGAIRTIVEGDKVLFCASDVAKALGYSNPRKAIDDHCPHVTKRDIGVVTGKKADGTEAIQQVDMSFIPEGDVYRLIVRSKLPSAERFEGWVMDEVLPSIRKTGRYRSKSINENELKIREYEAQAKLANAKARQQNAQTKQAEMWLRLRELTNIKEYKAIAESYAGNTLAGAYVLSLPKAEEKTYSATEIGNIIGISANKVGMIANANNLKTEEYGKIFYDKSRYSNKEVETFRYYENVIPLMRGLVNNN